MSYDEGMAQRLREALSHRHDVVEKKMFGGIAFMVSGNMCCGVVDDTMMARVGPERYEQALGLPHAREMDFTGRPMRGFVFVHPDGLQTDEELGSWVRRCEDFADSLAPK